MTNDITADLQQAMQMDREPWDETLYRRAINEIGRLRSALAIAAGMLSTSEPYTDFHPEDILKMLTEEASRG